MKRLTILVIFALVMVLLYSASVESAPPGPPGGLAVNVVSPLPLPVTGAVDATVTGNVTVVNKPVVKAEQQGDWSLKIENPILEVVQEDSGFSDGSSPVDLYKVPEGTRLVIENVSFAVLGGQPLVVFEAKIETNVGGNYASHCINIPPVVNYTDSSDNQHAYCGGGQVTKIYADPQTMVRFWCEASSTHPTMLWSGSITISGHLVPYE